MDTNRLMLAAAPVENLRCVNNQGLRQASAIHNPAPQVTRQAALLTRTHEFPTPAAVGSLAQAEISSVTAGCAAELRCQS